MTSVFFDFRPPRLTFSSDGIEICEPQLSGAGGSVPAREVRLRSKHPGREDCPSIQVPHRLPNDRIADGRGGGGGSGLMGCGWRRDRWTVVPGARRPWPGAPRAKSEEAAEVRAPYFPRQKSPEALPALPVLVLLSCGRGPGEAGPWARRRNRQHARPRPVPANRSSTSSRTAASPLVRPARNLLCPPWRLRGSAIRQPPAVSIASGVKGQLLPGFRLVAAFAPPSSPATEMGHRDLSHSLDRPG
jgi:hypothetical protein